MITLSQILKLSFRICNLVSKLDKVPYGRMYEQFPNEHGLSTRHTYAGCAPATATRTCGNRQRRRTAAMAGRRERNEKRFEKLRAILRISRFQKISEGGSQSGGNPRLGTETVVTKSIQSCLGNRKQTHLNRSYIESNYGTVHFISSGAGPALLLFHINRQSSETYFELMKYLSNDFHAIAMDYPGYGRSQHLAEQPAIGDYAACARELLFSQGKRQAFVLGEAVGAAVAACFAASFPEVTLGAVLLNCPVMPEGRAAELVSEKRQAAARHQDPEQSGFDDAQTYLSRNGDYAPLAPSLSWLRRIEQAQGQCRPDCWQAAEALLAFDFPSALSAIRCPTLLLTGEFSPFREFKTAIETSVPDLTSEIVPGGRFAMGWEKAGEVARRTIEFASTASAFADVAIRTPRSE